MNQPKAPAIHREEFVVPESAIDRNSHVNNVAFVQWMQDVATRHFDSGGVSEAMEASGGTWVARSHKVEYLSPAFAGEHIQALTWIVDFSRVRSLRRYKFLRVSDGKLLVRGKRIGVREREKRKTLLDSRRSQRGVRHRVARSVAVQIGSFRSTSYLFSRNVKAMTTFAVNCSDEEIRKAVVEWSELLAQCGFAEALSMFEHTTESFGFEWTPAHLEDWVSNYGCARKDYDSGEHPKITSLFEQPNNEQFVRKAIKVDREKLYGLDPNEYVGMVHYYDVPLDGEPSDLTARFHIKKVGVTELTLEFLDIHVM